MERTPAHLQCGQLEGERLQDQIMVVVVLQLLSQAAQRSQLQQQTHVGSGAYPTQLGEVRMVQS